MCSAIFWAEAPTDNRALDAVARTRTFNRGELEASGEIRRRLLAVRAAGAATSPAGAAAARATAQAAAVAHMGAHALGAALYYAIPLEAVVLAEEDATRRPCWNRSRTVLSSGETIQ
ncbi:putative immunity protein [Nocardiopsis kunsanensis]|uniref:Imm-5-like domain-containing protein n=1 Tax=Nocardiopsis kunsanensis TaxID=141693 RepID=A0A918X7N4_9ACTN|nr:hypothetical protein GCM10007147_05980 [Nocardiopsis kunsanensis]